MPLMQVIVIRSPLSSEENTDYIMEVIENMLAMKDFKSFDLKPFFAKVKETVA